MTVGLPTSVLPSAEVPLPVGRVAARRGRAEVDGQRRAAARGAGHALGDRRGRQGRGVVASAGTRSGPSPPRASGWSGRRRRSTGAASAGGTARSTADGHLAPGLLGAAGRLQVMEMSAAAIETAPFLASSWTRQMTRLVAVLQAWPCANEVGRLGGLERALAGRVVEADGRVEDPPEVEHGGQEEHQDRAGSGRTRRGSGRESDGAGDSGA